MSIFSYPFDVHLVTVWILRFLKRNLTHGATLHKPASMDMIWYCDLDWPSYLDDIRSIGARGMQYFLAILWFFRIHQNRKWLLNRALRQNIDLLPWP